ncbi:MAG: acetyl-CoA carboxylase biotin carboxyl carrier protein subunit [Acetobacteraceae bacterium]
MIHSLTHSRTQHGTHRSPGRGHGKVWELLVAPGARVGADEPLMVVESMKMEILVSWEEANTVVELLVAEGDAVEGPGRRVRRDATSRNGTRSSSC